MLWNNAWSAGYFITEWKQENRVEIPKIGRDDYNDCNSYRIVSITSCLVKRFKHITSQRLITALELLDFDDCQFACMKERSATQALLILVEQVQKVGVVFYDFTDAFRTVNGNRLLYKLGNDFGISGKLFLHIHSFLSDRFARIKIDNTLREWIESEVGTSPGTALGPLLFIVDGHDVPHCISPKFADDMVTIAVDDDIHVEQKLQQATNDLTDWSQNEGMDINVSKTKVMVFGNQTGKIDTKIHGSSVENVTSYKYLGILLDSDLNFSMHTEYAVGKAKRASAKICRLIEGDRCTSEYRNRAIQDTSKTTPRICFTGVWSSIPEKDVLKLEKVQHQCLKRMIGSKAHSSSAAAEVAAGVLPFRFQKRELCCREYARKKCEDENHLLVKLLKSSIRAGMRFCPLEYIRVVSTELERAVSGCIIRRRSTFSVAEVMTTTQQQHPFNGPFLGQPR